MEKNQKNVLYQKDFSTFKSMHNDSSRDYSSDIFVLFEKHLNPYEFLLACLSMTSTKELQAKDSFLLKLISEFQNFINLNNNKQKYSSLLTPSIQLETFGVIKKIKCNIIQVLLVNCYSLSTAPDIIVPLLVEDLQSDNVKNTINIINNLAFESNFDAKDILIPLFLQNKTGVIDEFLKCDNSYRQAFLQVLDKIVGLELQVSDLLLTYNIRRIKNVEALKPKSIFKLGIRLMKKFGIPSNTCPNIMIRHNKSSLRYLFSRHYLENGITLESLLLFAKELSEKNDTLKKEVLDLFVDYFDHQSAYLYLKDVPVPESDIPHQLKDPQGFIDNAGAAHNANKAAVVKNNDYYQLSLPLKFVIMVDTIEHFQEAVNHFSACDVIAIDTEWKPLHQFDEDEKLSLLQIASNEKVYIFDMIVLPTILNEQHWNHLGKLLSDETIMKLSYAFSGDKKQLGATNKYLKEHVNKMKNSIDLDNIKVALLERNQNIYSYKNVDHKGLSEMVFLCFGKPLDKTEQCSYWTVRPLSLGQLIYSALDAYCLIEIYFYLNEKCKQLSITDWKYLRPSQANSSKRSNPQGKQIIAEQKLTKNHIAKKFIYGSDFKVVCDTMLQGLGKLLRCCNVDTEILKTDDSHDKCLEYFGRQRIVLTKGNVYHRLRKYIPGSHIYCLKNDTPKMQLQELVTHFNVVINENDIFARCASCNCNEYLYLDPSVVSKMKNNSSLNHSNNSNMNKSQWVNVEGGSVDIYKGVTDKNIHIKHSTIPYSILNKVRVIYLCAGCGKCYWDGSHTDRFLKDISSVIKMTRTLQVPPP